MPATSSVNPIKDLASAIAQVSGKPCLAAHGLKINTGSLSSKNTKVWMEDVVRDKIALQVALGHNLWMFGPAGVGKSTIIQAVLEGLGDRFYRFQGHAGIESSDWYGAPEFDANGNIRVIYSEVVKAMEEGIPIVIEEFNMINPVHKGPLFSMLDSTSMVDIQINGDVRRIKKHPGFQVFVTANDNGTGDKLHLYGGGEIENKALVSRFVLMELGYLPETMEKEMLIEKTGLADRTLLDGMLSIATQTREVAASDPSQAELAISPRNMIMWAKNYVGVRKHGISLNHEHLAELCLLDRLPESLRSVLREMVINKLSTINIQNIKVI